MRQATSLNKLLYGLMYIFALVAWNWICSHQYDSVLAERPTATAVDSVQPRVAARVSDTPPRAIRFAARPSTEVKAETPATATTTATTTAAAAAVATAKAATAAAVPANADEPSCSKPRRPYHTLLTTQASIYQQWQSRIMYFHYMKQRKLDGPCTEMGGFTRLVASEEAKADGLEGEMPSVFVRQYTTAEIAQYGHFGVLNRPYSVVQFIANGGFERIREAYIYIAETDHVLMRPLPNLATEDKAAAFSFGYMHAGYGHQKLIDRFAPGVTFRSVQPVGPSPLIIRKGDLARVATPWLNLSLRLKLDREADTRFGWVLEMWGWSIAAAQHGIVHEVLPTFQLEGGAGISAKQAQARGTYIFHYTYGLEYTLGGRPQGVNQIGEWSLDKRHYGGAYPPRKLQPPPAGASDGAEWLLDAFNEASAGIPAWPETKSIGTIGWRRVKGAGIANSPLAKQVAGTSWSWAGIKGMTFASSGELITPWGKGVWGCLPEGVDYNDRGFCRAGCLFADFGSALHNVKFDLAATPAPTFDSYRVGDGAHVPGVKQEG